MPKFDYIIQNPPYAKTLHIDFFKKGIELLNDTGKMTIIEPALWLLSILRNGNTAKYYAPFKNQVNHHIEEIAIDNLNDMFGTLMMYPFSITKLDSSHIIPGLKLLTVLLLPPGNLIIVGEYPVTLFTLLRIFSKSLK